MSNLKYSCMNLCLNGTKQKILMYIYEDTKGVIRSGRSKNKHYNGQEKKDKQLSAKPLHRKLYIE